MGKGVAIRRGGAWLLLALLLMACSVPAAVAAAATTTTANPPTLEQLQQELAEVRKASTQPRPKDTWDKVSAVAALASGLLVAVIGGFATFLYNRRQNRVQADQANRDLELRRIETVRGFFEPLSGTDARQKGAALLMIRSLDPDLAVRLATVFGDEGSVRALSQIAASAPDDAGTAEAARQGLETALEALRASVVQIGEPMRATGFLVRSDGLIATTAYALDDDATEVDVVLPGDVHLKAEVLPRLPDTGVALLQVAMTETPALALADGTKPPTPLQEVVVMGATPAGMMVSVGPIVAVETTLPDIPVADPMMLARLDIEAGQGGAPVVDATGRVAGLVYGSMGTGDGKTAILLPIDGLVRELANLDSREALAGAPH